MRDDIEEIQDAAKTLHDAKEEIDYLLDEKERMLDDGTLPDDETTDEMVAEMETARDVCERLSKAFVIGAAQHGVLLDLSDDADSDGDGGPRSFQ